MLCNRYVTNYKTLLSYAARRNRKAQLLERIRKYIPEEVLEVAEND